MGMHVDHHRFFLHEPSASFTPARVRCKVRQLSRSIDQTIRLSPHDPNMGNIYWRIGLAHLLQSRTDDAILWIEKARTANPALSFVHAWLASAYALKGKTERAAAELAKARSLRGQGSHASIARIAATGHWGVPKIRALLETTYFAGLRKAGRNEGYPCRLRSLVKRAAQGCNTASS
jgi:tetratricopeptide (TPR) repeat protein